MGAIFSKQRHELKFDCPICSGSIDREGDMHVRLSPSRGVPLGPRRVFFPIGGGMLPSEFTNMTTNAGVNRPIKVPCCKQMFHSGCLLRWVVSSGRTDCPLCRSSIHASITFAETDAVAMNPPYHDMLGFYFTVFVLASAFLLFNEVLRMYVQKILF